MPDSTYQRFLRIVATLKMFAFLIDFIGSMRSNMTRSSRPNLPNMHLLKKTGHIHSTLSHATYTCLHNVLWGE